MRYEIPSLPPLCRAELDKSIEKCRRIISDLPRDTDLLSFLDGQQAYIEIGQERGGDGYVVRQGDGWSIGFAKGQNELHTVESGYATLRDALEALQEKVSR